MTAMRMRLVESEYNGQTYLDLLDGNDLWMRSFVPEKILADERRRLAEVCRAMNFCRTYLPRARCNLAAILKKLDDRPRKEIQIQLKELARILEKDGSGFGGDEK